MKPPETLSGGFMRHWACGLYAYMRCTHRNYLTPLTLLAGSNHHRISPPMLSRWPPGYWTTRRGWRDTPPPATYSPTSPASSPPHGASLTTPQTAGTPDRVPSKIAPDRYLGIQTRRPVLAPYVITFTTWHGGGRSC